MYKRIHYFLTYLCVISIVGSLSFSCQSKDPSNNEHEKEVIKNTLVQMWDAIEKEDMVRYATFIHPDFTQFGESDPVLRIGKDAELKGIASWVAESENIHTEMLDPRVTIKGEMAYLTYYWSDQGISNGVRFATKGKSTRIFVREGDTWLCIHGHYTLLPEEITSEIDE